MKRYYLGLILGLCCIGCRNQAVEEELAGVHRAQTVLGNTDGAIDLYFRVSSNKIASIEFESLLAELTQRDSSLKALLTKKLGGTISPAILNTNLSAWTNSSAHKEEIAAILPSPIQKDGRVYYVGIRFSGELVYFTSLTP